MHDDATQDELRFRDLATAPEPALLPPSAELWPRIAAAHRQRVRRRRARRIAGVGMAAMALLAVMAIGLRVRHEPSNVDWQARAQALELQLNAAIAQRGAPASGDMDAELERVDLALQAAYDRGASKSELVPLWKQRSELLSVLLAARQQQLALTRI